MLQEPDSGHLGHHGAFRGLDICMGLRFQSWATTGVSKPEMAADLILPNSCFKLIVNQERF